MTVIEFPDDQVAALKAKAAAAGLTLEAWFKKLAEDESPLFLRYKLPRTSLSLACATCPLKSWKPCPKTVQASTTITSTVGPRNRHGRCFR